MLAEVFRDKYDGLEFIISWGKKNKHGKESLLNLGNMYSYIHFNILLALLYV